jgi:hypothetical protein
MRGGKVKQHADIRCYWSQLLVLFGWLHLGAVFIHLGLLNLRGCIPGSCRMAYLLATTQQCPRHIRVQRLVRRVSPVMVSLRYARVSSHNFLGATKI